MIHVVYEYEAGEAGELVHAALCRAFSVGQVARTERGELDLLLTENEPLFVLFVDPCKEMAGLIQAACSHPAGAKIALFGKLPFPIAEESKLPFLQESDLCVAYRRSLGGLVSPILERPFLRYDFAEEWNNLGYGAIRLDDSPWALSQWAHVAPGAVIAEVVQGDAVLSTYAAIWDEKRGSILWFNRAVGPIDSQEWRLVEHFFASYRHAELPCLPVLSEIPFGWDAAVTMRLDCDEDIASARALFEQYRAWNVPFSLALHTSILKGLAHTQLVHDVINNKGAILSHSHTHPAGWGGCYQAACHEAQNSRSVLQHMFGKELHHLYAVSPFHHTPSYALRALSDANYLGCIGGTISSDPEFFLARGGHLHGSPPGFIGHSQSCMLHGDCLLKEGDPLRIYKEAFLIALRGRGLFGFLDHPISKRYSYGWQSEAQRTEVHRQWIEFMRRQGRVLFLNEQDALDFIRYKSSVKMKLDKNGKLVYHASLPPPNQGLDLAVELAGHLVNITGENESSCSVRHPT